MTLENWDGLGHYNIMVVPAAGYDTCYYHQAQALTLTNIGRDCKTISIYIMQENIIATQDSVIATQVTEGNTNGGQFMTVSEFLKRMGGDPNREKPFIRRTNKHTGKRFGIVLDRWGGECGTFKIQGGDPGSIKPLLDTTKPMKFRYDSEDTWREGCMVNVTVKEQEGDESF